MHPEIDPSAEEEIKVEIGEVIIIETITDTITEIDQEADGTINRSNNYQTSNREGNTRQNYGQNAQQTFRNRSQSRNRAGNYNNEYMRGRSRDRNNDRPIQSRQSMLSHGRNESRSTSNSRVSTNHDHVRCYRCREYDHFASECPNMLTDEELDYNDADPASLHMMTQDHYPIDSEGEIEYLNL